MRSDSHVAAGGVAAGEVAEVLVLPQVPHRRLSAGGPAQRGEVDGERDGCVALVVKRDGLGRARERRVENEERRVGSGGWSVMVYQAFGSGEAEEAEDAVAARGSGAEELAGELPRVTSASS